MKDVNLKRLKDCMKRAEAGEELTIGFLGGSITQGSLATTMENTYAYRVFTWWKQTFPKANVHYVNGGIGGTTSHYGVSRAVTDVLMYQPDFIVVDFSVNDEADIFFQETYEGVVRKLLSWDSKPAVVLLNNVFYDTGLNAQEYHNEVGNWYQVPHVSVRDTIYQRMKAGEYIREELTPDGLHPNDKGHKLVAEEIEKFLESVKAELEVEEKEPVFPKAMTENAYENAKRLTIREISPKLCGFHADTEESSAGQDYKDESGKIVPMKKRETTGITLMKLDANHRVMARYRVNKIPFTIGRSTSNDLVLDDLCVARNHCRIIERDGRYLLEDVGTMNKLYVNGMVTGQVPLSDGLRVYIGNEEFQIAVEGGRSQSTRLYKNAEGSYE